MKFRMLPVLFLGVVGLAALTAGCGEKAVQTADSPTEVFKKIIAAIKRADVDAVEKLVSEDFEEESKEELAELRRGDEAMMRKVDEIWGKAKIEYVSEKIDGDLAAVKVVISNDGEKEQEQSFGFKRIGGAWKLLGDSEGRAVVKQLSLKGAPPDAVALEYIKYDCKLSKELVMLCGGAKRRELEKALAASKNGNSFSELRIWTEELRELAADGDGDRKEPKDEKRAGNTAEGCLDLSECTHAAVLETVDGDLAVVKVRGPRAGKVRKGRMYLLKFDGEWKIVWKYEYDRAKAARKGC